MPTSKRSTRNADAAADIESGPSPELLLSPLPAVPFVTTGAKSDGWTAGAGVECAITDSILLRIEYRYTSLEALGFANTTASSADAGTRAPISDLRVGFAYKL